MPPETPSGTRRPDGGHPCRLSFDGRTIHARPGQTVGAALVAAGVVAWRATRAASRPRGLFCGIGVCYDCLITVDGRPDQRACLVPAADGMRLESGLPGRAADARDR
ncbi:(2Fe-2S)-binding protein [Streptomyces sparsogenes]|uniref:(2Fe-2S)-binding protein n=1 Tax=Streptomyces sparsogenes TaxID=67365 RepID=UPI0033E26DEB